MRIAEIIAHPLAIPVAPGEHKTAWGEYSTIGIVVVELRTDDGIVGFGEALSRKNPRASALLIDEVYAPGLIGQDPRPIARHWQAMLRQMSGRAGGAGLEAISAIDIALWDAYGRRVGEPIHRLLGGVGRESVAAYASAISWRAQTAAERQIETCLSRGFRSIKIKLGGPVDEAIDWAREMRRRVGKSVALSADANWAFDVADATKLARALEALDYVWLEEPLPPEDVAGYARLSAKVDIRIAAGESEHVCATARDLVAAGGIGLFQPDCTRSGGITETRRLADLADAYGVGYAPHVGGGGAISAAANLQLAAAMPNFQTYECMIFANALRTELVDGPVGDAAALVGGEIPVPQGPGLGIEIDRSALKRLRAN